MIDYNKLIKQINLNTNESDRFQLNEEPFKNYKDIENELNNLLNTEHRFFEAQIQLTNQFLVKLTYFILTNLKEKS